LPYKQFKEKARKPAVQLPQHFVTFVTIENGIDCFQRPSLVEDNVAIE
jgi:hypothetical protein